MPSSDDRAYNEYLLAEIHKNLGRLSREFVGRGKRDELTFVLLNDIVLLLEAFVEQQSPAQKTEAADDE